MGKDGRASHAAWAGLLTLSFALAGCAGHPAPGAASQGPAARGSGTANVAYAGSLQLVNDKFLAPLFTKRTGLQYKGQGGGALGMAQLIRAKTLTPNVFESMGAAPVRLLMPQFTRYAISCASSPLVVAYSPASRFAPQLRAIAEGKRPLRDLFLLMERKGFHLGRTNPNTDPQGQAFILMVKLAVTAEHLPKGTVGRVLGGLTNPQQIFAEEAILSRLQAGQLDASSAFLSEAVQRGVPYIPLPNGINLGDPALAAQYGRVSIRLSGGQTVRGAPLEVYATTVAGTPDQAAGRSFLSFLLSAQGRSVLRKEGFALVKPVVIGDAGAVPANIRKEIGR